MEYARPRWNRRNLITSEGIPFESTMSAARAKRKDKSISLTRETEAATPPYNGTACRQLSPVNKVDTPAPSSSACQKKKSSSSSLLTTRLAMEQSCVHMPGWMMLLPYDTKKKKKCAKLNCEFRAKPHQRASNKKKRLRSLSNAFFFLFLKCAVSSSEPDRYQ